MIKATIKYQNSERCWNMKYECHKCSNLIFTGILGGFFKCSKGHTIVKIPEETETGFKYYPCATNKCPDKILKSTNKKQ